MSHSYQVVIYNLAIVEKNGYGFFQTLRSRRVSRRQTRIINRHIIRIASSHRAILGPLSSLAGCQPRALEVAGSNPAGPIVSLDMKRKSSSFFFLP